MSDCANIDIMYITEGTFNIILKQSSLLGLDESSLFSTLDIDRSLLDKPTNKMDADIVGRLIEYMANQKPAFQNGSQNGIYISHIYIGCNTQYIPKLRYTERCVR